MRLLTASANGFLLQSHEIMKLRNGLVSMSGSARALLSLQLGGYLLEWLTAMLEIVAGAH